MARSAEKKCLCVRQFEVNRVRQAEATPFPSPPSKLNRVSYQGLILDFGGVVTTDLFAELSAFCIREGLDPDTVVRVLRDTAEGRSAIKAVEAATISQREFEVTIGRLLGVDDRGLLTRALAGFRPRPEILELIKRARETGIRVASCRIGGATVRSTRTRVTTWTPCSTRWSSLATPGAQTGRRHLPAHR